MIKRIIHKIFNSLGYTITKHNYRPDSSINTNTMKEALKRSLNNSSKINTIIDVGAAQGNWSVMAMEFFPKANYILFEPLEERKETLNSLSKKHTNFHIVNKAAGEKEGEIDFYITSDLDGSGIADNGTNAKKTVIELTTLDIETEKQKLPGPYLIKLDTHGFEVPILDGASNILSNTSMIIIECYGYRIAPNSLLFGEMCQYMDSKGFRLMDIVDVVLRPKDNTFWQCDAFFIPSTAKCFLSNTYH